MITNELLEYIKGERLRNIPLEKIKIILLENGWASADIEEAFNTLYKPEAPKIETPKIETIKTEPVKNEPVTKQIGEMNINPNLQSSGEVVFKPEPIIEKKIERNVETPVLGIGESLGQIDLIQKNISNNITKPLPTTDVQKPKSNLKKILFIVFLVIVASSSALVAYGYYSGYFVSLPNVSTKALNLMSQANAVAYDITASVDMSGVKKDKLSSLLPADIFSTNSGSITFRGAFDKSDINNLKLNNIINFKSGMINASVETRVSDNVLYAQVTKMPMISLLGDLSNFTNKWIKIPIKSENVNTALPMPSVSNFAGVDASILENLTPAQKDEFIKITEQANFIKIVEKLPMEQITDGKAYHFSFTLDEIGIKTYLINLKDFIGKIGKDNSVLASFDPIAKYDEASRYIKDFKGEAWIGKDDGLPQKISIKIVSYINPDIKENGTGTLNLVAILKDWNKPVDVMVPADSMSFQDIINQFMEQAKIKAADESIKAAIGNLNSQTQTYKTTKKSFKGYCASKEAKWTLDQFKSNNISQIACLDTKTEYIIAAKLSAGTYFCADSSNTPKEVPKKPVGFVCE